MVSAALRIFSSAITKTPLSPVLTRAGISYRSVILTMAGGCGPSPPVESETKAPKSCCPPKESAQTATNAKSCCPPKVAEGAEKAKSCCPPKVAQVSGNATSCCPPKVAASSAPDAVTRGDVSEYYGKTLTSQSDLLTSACVIGGEETKEVRQLVKNIHPEILDKFYGCGSPIPPLLKGCTVLDLGCGTGRDVYTCAQLVGEEGRVIGIDMTDEQLEVGRKHLDWQREKFGFKESNVSLRKALIEDLSAAEVESESVDVVVSNCVINLAPDKAPVFREIARVLKPGGELYFSDVYTDRRVPAHLQKDKVLFGECLSGALYWSDFQRLMREAGLSAWGTTSARKLSINNDDVSAKVGPIGFYSVTVRAVKVAPSHSSDYPEDYGQVATYDGSITSEPKSFTLDQARVFPVGQPIPVDYSTAAMLETSRYSKAFNVTQPGNHIGLFSKWTQQLASSAGCSLESCVGLASGGEETPCCC